MSVDGELFGLGAIPSPVDVRDHGVPLDTAIVIPPRWLIGRDTPVSMAPVTNQHALPECGGYTIIDVLRYRAKVEGKGVPNLDPHVAYRRSRTRLGFTPIPREGTTARAILETGRKEGVPEVGKPATAANHTIGSYGALPFTAGAIMTALVQYGSPVVIGMAWPSSFFRPVRGVMPAPGAIAGGHLGELIGFDFDVAGGSALWQNHAGPDWGQGGRAWIPWRYLLRLIHDAWKVLPAGGSVRPTAI